MRVLSFDSGETTGWAYQDERDDYPKGLLGTGNIKDGVRGISLFLKNWDLKSRPVDIVVAEKYIVWGSKRGKKANIGTAPVAIRVNGIIESWCYLNDVPLHMEYDSNMCALQALKTGLDPKTAGNHSETHWIYAANHGRMYLIEMGLAKDNGDLNPIKIDPWRTDIDPDEAYRKLFP